MTASSGGGSDSAAKDVKDKYREALERKKAASASRTDAAAEHAGKVHGAHSAESHRKEFRRKSGG